ncbi:MAG: glutathione S-transferase [Bdellovibrio sp. CG12_big_fil_rev_8_21_14_0_65_39_13]|nr:MAG: glutathione S-transferase [Bdellovibrio sp. CG22_combo_CG10-13_8_21_14_all_39_27]PIQ57909.1 MAG: glutathione S-transferase [Bdellovibrio sp. CG12_big_fil_rev_8_21_14_0_65_39_13]PIR35097.1 MAG: glutathione S-transferase [Bdellovibrio sp. CG11_big_fil_rev_8_21_14_0_20_39_38]
MDLNNPVTATYVIAAGIMILKLMGQGWITVYRMMKVGAGFRNPEDANKGLLNANPNPNQIEPNEYVERSRRMHLNDLENIPAFLVAGLLFSFTNPSLLLAQVLMYGFVAMRAMHFIAYSNAWSHEVRATFFTFGSLAIMFMAGYSIYYVF